MKAKRHPIGTTLATAVDANHPESPAQVGARTMSGRKHQDPKFHGPSHAPVGMGGATGHPAILVPPPRGRQAAAKPNPAQRPAAGMRPSGAAGRY